MSFLAPLFALGALAVAAPILFHLIRRTTRERFRFSSLMFLQPSPPRMTRQSRLENLLLLLLRCLVLCLLALGFSRPFLQRPTAADPATGEGRRITVLLDVSASMRQEGLWEAARARAEAILREARPQDTVALLAFDQSARPLLSFEQWSAVAPPDRVALGLQRLADTTPGWRATHLGNALATAVETLEDNSNRDLSKPTPAGRRIVVLTDLQEGARLDGLQGFEWPKGLEIDLQPLKPARPTNAGLHLVPEADDRERQAAETEVKIRVSNAAGSKREQFQVGWAKADGTGFAAPPTDVYVPPGQSRVATIPIPTNTPPPATGWEVLRLNGDDAPFDNTAYHVPPKPEQIRVLYLGADNAADSAQPLYYIRRAFLETRRLKVEVLARPGTAPLPAAETAPANLLIAAGPLAPEGLRTAREFLDSGRTVLLSLTSAEAGRSLADLLGLGTLEVREATGRNYSLLGQIDFQHPLFAPFADPRYSDFTKIHFWKHRVLDPAAFRGARVVARFDDQTPALLEIPSGKGSLLVLTCGWHPSDSQFALSSKFVPILYSLLELGGAIKAQLAQYVVGDTLSFTSTNTAETVAIRTPEGRTAQLAAGQRFSATEAPGIYTGTLGAASVRFGVNLESSESRTSPLPIEDLERLGVPLKPPTAADAKKEAEKKERLQAAELEQRQKLWRWLLVAALVFLLLETAVAGRLTRQQAPAPA